MSISLYQASVPVFKKMLVNLKAILAKAEAHATAKKIEPSALLTARLYPDMFALPRQVQIASDSAKGACARLAGQEPPKFEDNETTFAELGERLDKTIAFLDTLQAAQIDGQEDRDIVLTPGGRTMQFKGLPFLLNWALPNFYFHVMTAYAILRHNGVEIGKKDFMGAY